MDTYVGEEVEETYYIKVPGCCITYDAGIIYKTASGYKYVSIQENYFNSIPNREVTTLEDYNKKLIEINVDDQGNCLINEDTLNNDESNNQTKVENQVTNDDNVGEDQVSDLNSNESTNNEESTQQESGDSTSFAFIISGLSALYGLIKCKSNKNL